MSQTSLMNMLALRLAKAKGKGDQMVDSQKYNKAFLKKVSGYVMQVPRHLPTWLARWCVIILRSHILLKIVNICFYMLPLYRIYI
jgi:hypothetical protein